MFCGKCGKELTGKEKFCPKCGAAVQNLTRDKIEKYRERSPAHNAWSIQTEPPKKKGKKYLKIIIACLVIVIAAGGIAAFFFLRGSEEYEYLAVVENEDGLFGCINEKKKEIIECQYNVLLLNAEEGNVIVWKETGSNGDSAEYKMGVLDMEGQVIVPIEYAEVEMLNVNGEIIFALAEETGVDEKGEPVLNWGFANSQGEMITEFKYQYGSNGVPGVSTEVKGVIPVSCYVENVSSPGYIHGAIDNHGIEVIPLDSQYISPWQSVGNSGILAIERPVSGNEMKAGFVTYNNETVIPFEYDDARNFTENGLAAVKQNGKWGYIDKAGNVVIPFKYDNAYDFSTSGLARVESGDTTIYINETGSEIIEGTWNLAYDFDENGYATVSEDTGEGLVDTDGNYVFPCVYDSILSQGKIYVAEGGSGNEGTSSFVIMDSSGNTLMEGVQDFDTVWGMGDNGWIATGTVYDQDEEGRARYQCNYINEYGDIKLRLPQKYNYASPFEKMK